MGSSNRSQRTLEHDTAKGKAVSGGLKPYPIGNDHFRSFGMAWGTVRRPHATGETPGCHASPSLLPC
ncbi:hypothetical protein CHELA40_13229 [Chelatococcus asaccharovorans]|nr:hypothetical protein CHELA40_13229 [Chelatococcus asaccharovorans]